MHKKNSNIALNVSINTMILNIFLTFIKLISGIIGNSSAMISDSVHSASDVFSTIIVIIGIKMSEKDADKNHPYGHEKIESIASFMLSFILLLTAFGIGYKAVISITKGINGNLKIPNFVALFSAIGSIILKEIMYRYTRFYSERVNSSALLADAWHHRSDALSSIGSLAGILAARLGFPIFDPIASLFICIIIFKAAFNIGNISISQLIDTAASDDVEEQIKNIILNFEDVKEIDIIKTRLFGNRIYVDIEIQIDKNMSLQKSHEIVHLIHDKIESENKMIKHCMIHVNPSK